MNIKLFCLALILVSTNVFAQTDPMAGIDTGGMIARMQRVNRAVEDLSSLDNQKPGVLLGLQEICEKAVYSSARAKKLSGAVDIVSALDLQLCYEDLVITLSKYAGQK